jgi:hypothetical protein
MKVEAGRRGRKRLCGRRRSGRRRVGCRLIRLVLFVGGGGDIFVVRYLGVVWEGHA